MKTLRSVAPLFPQGSPPTPFPLTPHDPAHWAPQRSMLSHTALYPLSCMENPIFQALAQRQLSKKALQTMRSLMGSLCLWAMVESSIHPAPHASHHIVFISVHWFLLSLTALLLLEDLHLQTLGT